MKCRRGQPVAIRGRQTRNKVRRRARRRTLGRLREHEK